MKKSFYESPLCEALELDPESAMMQTGSPGQPGSELEILDPLVF